MRYRGAIFDFDGVITDGIPLHDEAYSEVFRALALAVPLDLLHTKIGMTPREVIADICRAFHRSIHLEEVVAQHHDILRELYAAKAKPAPHLQEFMDRLHTAHVPIGVASSTSSDILQLILEKFGIRKYVSVIIGGEAITKGKPDPEMLTCALQKLSIPGQEVFAIDDARSGIIAAKALSMYTIAYLQYSRKPISESDASVMDFDEIDLAVLCGAG